MVLLIAFLFFMPPNPWADTRKPIIQPLFPALMNTGRQRIEKPIGEKKAVVLLIDFTDNTYTYQSHEFDSLIYGEHENSVRTYYTDASFGRFTISTGSGRHEK